MSASNTIARGGSEIDTSVEPRAFEIPAELAARYDVRVVEAPERDDRRLGLFAPGDRRDPAIEIAGDRLVARRDDAETVADLVTIAKHNGWDRIDVEGAPEFRRAMWSAATREGLEVRGYEPSFAEAERLAELGRAAVDRRAGADLSSSDRSSPARRGEPDTSPTAGPDAPGLSEGDRRLLLTLSRHTEDRKGLYERLDPKADAFQREVQFERIDLNRAALTNALEQALGSPSLIRAFDRAGYQPERLREMGRGGEWDTDVAEAIYAVRSNLTRTDLAKGQDPAPGVDDARAGAPVEPSVAASVRDSSLASDTRTGQADQRSESEQLAELFLHGSGEGLTTEPRLAGALQAQAAMEAHIGEVFGGDADRAASARRESREMISDALRRGLDVSVREPTPVRQIEPIHALSDMER